MAFTFFKFRAGIRLRDTKQYLVTFVLWATCNILIMYPFFSNIFHIYWAHRVKMKEGVPCGWHVPSSLSARMSFSDVSKFRLLENWNMLHKYTSVFFFLKMIHIPHIIFFMQDYKKYFQWFTSCIPRLFGNKLTHWTTFEKVFKKFSKFICSFSPKMRFKSKLRLEGAFYFFPGIINIIFFFHFVTIKSRYMPCHLHKFFNHYNSV